MKLIQIKANQLPIIIELTKKIWPVAYGAILSKAQLDFMIQKFYNETALLELMQKGHIFYLAQDEKENFVGFVSYEINSVPDKTKIHKIYVLPETQGTGLGRQFFELVTKSPGPFFDTCNFSISPKSRINSLDAFLQAFSMTLRFADSKGISLLFLNTLAFLYLQLFYHLDL